MSSESFLPTTAESSDQPTSNLAAFVALAKRSPALPGVKWDDAEWILDPGDSVVTKQRSHKNYGNTLTFTTRETSGRGMMRVPASERAALPLPYADFAKASIRMHAEEANVSISILRRLLTAHQFLERELRMTEKSNSIEHLTIRHFEFAEEALLKEQASTTAYRVSQYLVHISRLIDERRLTARTIGYQTRLKRPLDGDELTEKGQAEGMKKMIAPEALDKLADMFASPSSDYERLIISIVGLFVVGGFRAGEALTIPVDCWNAEAQRGATLDPETGVIVSNEGILYAAEKAQDYRVKWLPKEAVEMARRACDDLERLCRPARQVAAWMEANPGRLKPLADLDANDRITGHEACERLGFAQQTHVNWKIFRELRPGTRGKVAWYRVEDIERWFLPNPILPAVLTMPSGRVQRLSQTLIVVWRNQFHGNRPALTFMPELMSHAVLSGEISPPDSHSNDGREGLLSKYGLHVTTKQFRHWLNTLADRGGISDIDLAKWMGRRDIAQNAAYKHGRLAVVTEATRELIRSGDAEGLIPRVYRSLAPYDREGFLKASVTAAHAMSYGLCVHNFAQEPCPSCNQCLRKCPEYIRVKGDMEQRQALLELKSMEQANLQRARAALPSADRKSGEYGAERWVTWAEETLAGIEEALAVDDDAAVEAGCETRVFKDPDENRQLKP